MAKTSNRPRFLVPIVVVVVAVFAWWYFHRGRESAPEVAPTQTAPETASAATTAHAVAADRIDPANENRAVVVKGRLRVAAPARDTQLGISADAVMLLRFAEMLQWQEQCSGGECRYAKVWSPQLISSRRFREQEGHENPARLPLTSARFSAGDVRLGAFRVDAAMIGNYRLASALQAKPVAYPVSASSLPQNLAISFRDRNGALYAGDDPEHPAIGDVRVSYRVIPALDVEMTGVQRGEKLMVQKSVVKSPQS